ncbi:Endocytosis and vacuole integrity protein [Microbotryomycetes sp. JL201]|nr:Endocytosis and vacuole integrity protein [Microbotryomycetes sp. JL201]
MATPSTALLQADYQSLSKEAGRRDGNVRDVGSSFQGRVTAADKAYHLLKTAEEHTLAQARSDPPPEQQPLYQPIFLAAATRNVKVIALAVSALQRLIAIGAVPKTLVKQIIDMLEHVTPQGVEIQLKVLQTLVSLLTTKSPAAASATGVAHGEALAQGDDLSQALELTHQLSTSRTPVVASTASATLRQMFMFVFERVAEEDASVQSAEATGDDARIRTLPPPLLDLDIPPREQRTGAGYSLPDEPARSEQAAPPHKVSLRPAARDAYLLLEDLCLLIAATADGNKEGEPSFLRWGRLSRTFGLELVESIVSGFGTVVRGQFSDLLTLESETFLTMFIRIIGPGDKGEGEGGHPAGTGGNSPIWMRVLALEIFRGLCGDFPLMIKFYERYDVVKAQSGSGSSVFSDLMTAFNRLATERPSALGTGAAVIYGSSMAPIIPHSQSSSIGTSATNQSTGGGGMLDSAMETGAWLAGAAGSVVGSSVGAVAGVQPAGLNSTTSSLKLQCIDQLDKADAPPIPDTYIFLLALQCLASLTEGFASYALSAYSTVMQSRPEQSTASHVARALPAVDWTTVKEDSTIDAKPLFVCKQMAEVSWPALLASFSFFIATNLDDDLFADVVSSLQNFTSVCGVLGLRTPREAFLTSLCKFAMPPAVVSHLASSTNASSAQTGGPDSAATALKTATSSVISAGAESLGLTSAALPVGLSSRNLICLKALIGVSLYLAGSLDSLWLTVFETVQNADFVLRVGAARGKKRAVAGASTPSTPAKGAPAHTSATPSKLAVIPTESDEQAVQTSISKLFEVSKTLDDEAFHWFIVALCRLSGEMIGLAMSEDGLPSDIQSSAASSSTLPNDSSVTGEQRSRRRVSGMTTTRSLKYGEKSFSLSKLGAVSLLNIQRIATHDAGVGWEPITSHLLLVLHYTMAPHTIRLQAAEVLDQILVAAPRNVAADDILIQRELQSRVLSALVDQSEPSLRLQSSTDIEIRRTALDTLFKVLETEGHSFTTGWDKIFHILRTACPPLSTSLQPVTPRESSHTNLDTITEDDSRQDSTANASILAAQADQKSIKSVVLVRTSFPSLQLICTDFLSALTADDLKDCIGTLSEFGRQQEDVNVALTAGGLLWGVSDHLQAKQREDVGGSVHRDIWMYLLRQLLVLCGDTRQEVRDGALATIFRSISLYGSTLTEETWHATLWEIVFPLIDSLSTAIAERNILPTEGREHEDVVPQPNGAPIRLIDKQWDDSKTLALKSMGDIFYEFLPSIVKTERYEHTWSKFVDQLRTSFVRDRPVPATAAMQALDKVLSISLDGSEASRIASSWEVAWQSWFQIGQDIAKNGLDVDGTQHSKTYTQANLEAYVRCILPIYTPPYISFDVARIKQMLSMLKAVLTYRNSPDFKPDIDGLSPLQTATLEAIAVVDLDVPGAASAVLADMSDYMTLAFKSAFETKPDPGALYGGRGQQVTYIALSKETMPHILWLFQRYKDDMLVYEQGAVEKMLQAYSTPMHLKYACPAPSKYSSAEALWKTATVNFLKTVKICVASLKTFGSDLPRESFEGIWTRIVDGFEGAVLADVNLGADRSYEDRRLEESFDLSLLVSLEQDILPCAGCEGVPDGLLRQLGKALQIGSRLYELNLPGFDTSGGSSQTDDDSLGPVETRFSPDFDVLATGQELFGTTADIIEARRERFAYWCFELLFLMCSDQLEDFDAVLRTYIADAPLRGKMPFPRVRQEELVFVLQRLIACRLRPKTLWASYEAEPSMAIKSEPTPTFVDVVRSTLLCSPIAHLYELHQLLTSLLGLSVSSPSVVSAYVPSRRSSGGGNELKGLPEGVQVGLIGSSADASLSEADKDSFIAKKVARKVVSGRVQVMEPNDPHYEQYTDETTGQLRKRKRAMPQGLSKRDERILRSVRRRAHYLDKGMNLCGFRVGWTFWLGLIPLAGDIASMLLGYTLVLRKCRQAELPAMLSQRMAFNQAVAFGIGLVPFVGDLLAAVWKANSRNAALLEAFLIERAKKQSSGNANVEDADARKVIDSSRIDRMTGEPTGTGTYTPPPGSIGGGNAASSTISTGPGKTPARGRSWYGWGGAKRDATQGTGHMDETQPLTAQTAYQPVSNGPSSTTPRR